ncbi:MAG: EamA family transporter [Eubacteriales bacterium]
MNKHAIFIVLAGILWGTTGYFTRVLEVVGLDTGGTIVLRCGLAALFFAVYMGVKNPKLFAVKAKDIWLILAIGLVSLLFFTFCYFYSMTLMSLSAAVILLYTAPAFVMVLSLFIFREKFTKRKIFALLLAFAGCVCSAGLGTGNLNFTFVGLLYGLGAGLGYGLYGIFARLLLDRGYQSPTINFYACLLASVGAGVIWGFEVPISIMASGWETAATCLVMGCLTCFLPYTLFTYGLNGVETGKAAIMASVEVVVATFVGVLAFGEPLTFLGMVGVVLVLSAIVVLNYTPLRGVKQGK